MCAVSGKASLPPAHSSSLSDSWACYRTVWWTSSNTFGDGLPQLVLTAAYLCYDPQLYHNCSSTNSFFLAARASLPSFELTRVHDRGNGASAHSMFLPTAFARPHVHCARLSCQHLGCVLNNLAPRHALSTRRLRGGWFFSSLCYSISFNFSFIVWAVPVRCPPAYASAPLSISAPRIMSAVDASQMLSRDSCHLQPISLRAAAYEGAVVCLRLPAPKASAKQSARSSRLDVCPRLRTPDALRVAAG